MASISEKIKKLRDEIAAVCMGCGRDFDDVTILAATKYASMEQVNEAIKAGISVIGENRVQDAKLKFNGLLPVRKHFIGHLQTNKVKEAVRLFDCMESMDSYRLAEAINEEAGRTLKKIQVLVEVNVAEDAKKYGLEVQDVRDFLLQIDMLKNLEVKGLMAIVPWFDDAKSARPYFGRMKTLFEDCRGGSKGFDILSMGMTGDFTVAIEEGATQVRIGSYLFK